MKEKNQILFIHGGMTFKKKEDYIKFLKTRKINLDPINKWNDIYLKKKLGKKFQIIKPRMPLQEYSEYKEWKIHFENYFPHLKNNIILIGESMGGIFLAKYLSENKFPRKILSTYLVAPPFDDSMPGEDLAGGFKLKSDLSLLEKNIKNLYLLFSKDDDVVTLPHAKKYKNKLKKAKIYIFKNKNGHFVVSKFPEIIKMIKNDIKRK